MLRRKYVLILSCLACLVTSSVYAANLAEIHQNKGIVCKNCHGEKQTEAPEEGICQKCHPIDALVKKTTPIDKTKQNPHYSPHYLDSLECTNCHKAHQPSVDFCASCHDFNFKVK